ncbi:class I SAM-dependent methyltransferase [Nocardiopsis sp. CT-R113]|uniref:Class I SAM-dependent methyltransferase n=1 Tax=Nocardiopsis codii TaxID=3065942 RepID=A0ABU7KBZ0_9ACTN|nr:class I SAM-dependent methyltransferase [Nocardiopsis sp. CT-R113]MEE2039707.1 class I SAM-dependent methyltransferase [Nocardiopsis sp. CT-R113]
MATTAPDQRPAALAAIEADTEAVGFTMSCGEAVGRLLRALAASKPGGRFLELGTGTGVGTAWLLAGMDRESVLDTVDNDPACLGVARRHHAVDPRVTVYEADGGEWLAGRADGTGPGYDLVFADALPGTFTHLDEALSLVDRGGFYVVDDLARQAEGLDPEGHQLEVEGLIGDLESRSGWELFPLLGWSCGVLVMVRR